MGISALATAGYAYLVGPVLRSLFLDSPATSIPSPLATSLTAEGVHSLSRTIAAAPTWIIGLAIVGAAGIKGLAYLGQTALAGQAGQQLLFSLRAKMYQGLLALNPLHSAAKTSGDWVTRFTLDAQEVENGVNAGLISFVRDGLQIAVLAGLALWLDPLLGAIGLLAFPPVALLIVRIGKTVRQRRATVHQAYGRVGGAVEETAVGLSTIQSFGAQPLVSERFDRTNRQILRSTIRAIRLRALSSPLNELLGAGALGLTLYYAHSRISTGGITPEAFISFFTALFLLYQPVKAIGQAGNAVQAGLAALDRLQPLLDRFAPRATAKTTEPGRSPAPKVIRLDRVFTGYSGGADVLKGVDLTVTAGEIVAVVGPSGAGKSTLINLLLGFLPLRQGQLLVDDKTLDHRSTAQLFAPVSQEPFLFDDTIRMNVRCGRPEATDDEITTACAAAGVLQFADTFADKLNAPVGPRGSALSLGQRQRVCLARALLSNAPVLLLDEVTASLDGQTEQALVDGVIELLDGRTALVVTHRLSTVRFADRIALLENGQINAYGPTDETMAGSTRFAELFGDQWTAQPEPRS